MADVDKFLQSILTWICSKSFNSREIREKVSPHRVYVSLICASFTDSCASSQYDNLYIDLSNSMKIHSGIIIIIKIITGDAKKPTKRKIQVVSSQIRTIAL